MKISPRVRTALCGLAVVLVMAVGCSLLSIADEPMQSAGLDFPRAWELRRTAKESRARAIRLYEQGKRSQSVEAIQEALGLERRLDELSSQVRAEIARLDQAQKRRPDGLGGNGMGLGFEDHFAASHADSRSRLVELLSDPLSDLQLLALVQESNEDYVAAAEANRSIAERVTGRVTERDRRMVQLRRDIARLDQLSLLKEDQRKAIRTAKRATALVATSHGPLGAAFCMDPRGLFVTRAPSETDSTSGRSTRFEYDQTHQLTSTRSEMTGGQLLGIVLNAGEPDELNLQGRVVRVDRELGIALLKADPPEPLPYLQLSNGREIVPKMDGLFFGRPPVSTDDFHQPDSIHVVQAQPAKVAAVRSRGGRPWIFTLDQSPPAGFSGGPLLDSSGKVFGVLICDFPDSGVHYAVPVEAIQSLLDSPLIAIRPPRFTYRERKAAATWRVEAFSRSPFRLDISARLIVGADADQRVFSPVGPVDAETFEFRAAPVAEDTAEGVELTFEPARGKEPELVPDRTIGIGSERVKLSELRRLELGTEPRGFRVDGRIVSGQVTGLDSGAGEAKALVFSYPPAKNAPIRSEAELHLGEKVLAHASTNVDVAPAPFVDVQGVLQAPAPRTEDVRGIKAPPIEDGPVNIPIPERIADVISARGGRYLVLKSPSKSVGIFDVNETKVVARFPLPSDSTLVAGGASKLILIDPVLKIIHRYDLSTMTLDRTAASPIDGEISAIALGASSMGPILAQWVNRRDSIGTISSWYSFIDPDTLKVLDVKSYRLGSSTEDERGPAPGILAISTMSSNLVHARASADGSLISLWSTASTPSRFFAFVIRDETVRGFDRHDSFGHLAPSPDGRVVYSGTRGVLPPDGAVSPPGAGNRPPSPSPSPCIPSTDSRFYLSVDGPSSGPPVPAGRTPNPPGPTSVNIHNATGETLRSLPDVAEMTGAFANQESLKHDFTAEKRFILIPEAKLLITIPQSNDRLVLRRVTLEATGTR
jgi:YD repeat-containing protein